MADAGRTPEGKIHGIGAALATHSTVTTIRICAMRSLTVSASVRQASSVEWLHEPVPMWTGPEAEACNTRTTQISFMVLARDCLWT